MTHKIKEDRTELYFCNRHLKVFEADDKCCKDAAYVGWIESQVEETAVDSPNTSENE